MEMITGRLTANATVKTISEGKEVVNFSIAVNDRYKTKGGGLINAVRYFRCAYWNRAGIAPHLKKGGLVELAGQIDFQVWIDKATSVAKGTLTMNVSNLKFLNGSKGQEENIEKPTPHAEAVKEDLPF